MLLFRKSKRRKTALDRMGKSLKKDSKEIMYATRKLDEESKPKQQQQQQQQQQDLPKKKKTVFLFPWWFKIVAYVMSVSIIGVSAFFIAIRGILLGDLEVKKWLVSFLSSVFSSVFLTQPIKVF
jgi:hypothetical protein